MDIKVVLPGNGFGLLKDATKDETMQTTVASLMGRKISYEDDLYDVWEQDIVPSGVAELSRLQQQGDTYIKP